MPTAVNPTADPYDTLVGGVNPGATQNPFDTASGLMGGAKDIYGGLADGSFLENINKYLNPYYDEVLTSTLGRMETDKNRQMMGIGDAAHAAGAFGGSRHGVVEGTFLGEHNKNVGDVTAGIKQQGWDNALRSMTENQYGAAGGMTGLGKDYFGIGRTINNDQAQAGASQENFLDRLLSDQEGAFNELLNDPYKTMDLLQAILGQDARRGAGSAESQYQPGLFDYLSLGAQAIGGL